MVGYVALSVASAHGFWEAYNTGKLPTKPVKEVQTKAKKKEIQDDIPLALQDYRKFIIAK